MADIFDLFKKIESARPERKPISFIVAGLGNPGDEYAKTRHNAGFMALDSVAKAHGAKICDARFKALCGEADVGGARALLIKPQTFMNLSGEAVAAAASFYKIAPENIVVIYDDINFDVGHMRIRLGGSAGGHNGMKSIISCLGSDAFPRIRVGVGAKPSAEYPLADWVLGKFSSEALKELDGVFGRVDGALAEILAGHGELAMSKYNR